MCGSEMNHVSLELAKEALQLCAIKENININDSNFPYRIDKIHGDIITLKRLRPSRCQLCNRVHEHENPYIRITTTGSVYFDCRRSNSNQKLVLGKLNIHKLSSSNDKDKPIEESEHSPHKQYKFETSSTILDDDDAYWTHSYPDHSWCSNVIEKLRPITISSSSNRKNNLTIPLDSDPIIEHSLFKSALGKF